MVRTDWRPPLEGTEDGPGRHQRGRRPRSRQPGGGPPPGRHPPALDRGRDGPRCHPGHGGADLPPRRSSAGMGRLQRPDAGRPDRGDALRRPGSDSRRGHRPGPGHRAVALPSPSGSRADGRRGHLPRCRCRSSRTPTATGSPTPPSTRDSARCSATAPSRPRSSNVCGGWSGAGAGARRRPGARRRHRPAGHRQPGAADGRRRPQPQPGGDLAAAAGTGPRADRGRRPRAAGRGVPVHRLQRPLHAEPGHGGREDRRRRRLRGARVPAW